MNISNIDLKLKYFNPNILVIFPEKRKIAFRLLLRNEMNIAWKCIFKQ